MKRWLSECVVLIAVKNTKCRSVYLDPCYVKQMTLAYSGEAAVWKYTATANLEMLAC